MQESMTVPALVGNKALHNIISLLFSLQYYMLIVSIRFEFPYRNYFYTPCSLTVVTLTLRTQFPEFILPTYSLTIVTPAQCIHLS